MDGHLVSCDLSGYWLCPVVDYLCNFFCKHIRTVWYKTYFGQTVINQQLKHGLTDRHTFIWTQTIWAEESKKKTQKQRIKKKTKIRNIKKEYSRM
jgi:hypothetical protein